MTQSTQTEDDALDAAFENMRATPPVVPDALMTKILADAMTELPKPVRDPFWRQVFGTLGGWPAVVGLAATTCVGMWMGGVLSDDLGAAFGLSQSAGLEIGESLGAFDLLLLDG